MGFSPSGPSDNIVFRASHELAPELLATPGFGAAESRTRPMPPSNVSRYELIGKIAEGGMGVVYKARDIRLDRIVALKFLSPNLPASKDKIELFFHEARAISKLNHPNIATIFEIDEIGDEPFLALEYLPGGTLREKIRDDYASGKRMPVRTIVSCGLAVARALAHAHRHGIVHRDVKTDNALLSEDDTVKLTDFGVAQVDGRRSAAKSDLTVGTAAYMAPEQAQGLEVDHRSDIFSFGAVLYELASGRVPFTGTAQALVLYEIVHSDPQPLSEFRNDLPDSLSQIVTKALEKDPDDRYAAMDEAVAALEAVRKELELDDTRPLKAELPSPTVAVLPFVDMSPEHDQEYFCDGMTEEIINVLTAVKGLKVVSRTSSFQYKGKAYDIREIGEKLNVQTVVEGSVRTAGNKLRITAQLIKVADGYHIWSQRYDREMTDVFEIQDEIAQAIVGNLKGKLVRGDQKPLVKKKTGNIEAYNSYLKGRHFLNQRNRAAILHSIECFEAAACADCDYALPYAGLAEAYILLGAGGYGEKDPAPALGKAREAALKAIQGDENSAEAHLALALVYYRADWDWESAEREFRRAIEINDGYATGHHQYAMFLAALKRPDEALAQIRKARELDPLSLIINTAMARILHFARRFDEAIEQSRRTLELNPQFGLGYFDIGVSYAKLGKVEETAAAFKKASELSGSKVDWINPEATTAAMMGDRKRAMELFEELKELSETKYISPMILAIVPMLLGDLDEAFDQIEKALADKANALVYLNVEPFFDPLRADPRYATLIKKMGFPE